MYLYFCVNEIAIFLYQQYYQSRMNHHHYGECCRGPMGNAAVGLWGMLPWTAITNAHSVRIIIHEGGSYAMYVWKRR